MSTPEPVIDEPSYEERQTRLWAMILHLSILAGHAVPILGLIAPIIIWQVKKEELPGVDVHGMNAVNWIISLLIYTFASLLLAFVLIGIPLLIILALLGLIFPLIAAIKASNGKAWKYPMSISFLK